MPATFLQGTGEDVQEGGLNACIVIAGPTASGKTGFAVALATALSGEIVNADAMQVYRGMDVGTAKPDEAEKKGIAHHLLDVVDPDQPFNAAMYRRMALPVMADILSRGKTCFVVGGTGLYIRALLGGLMDTPPSDPDLRATLRAECEALGPSRLHERLAHFDPVYARQIHPNDRVRIIRGLEIIALTGQSPALLMKRHRFGDRALRSLRLCLDVDRETLYDRINRRADAMVEKGLIQETRGLLDRGYPSDLKPMKAIGYRHMVRYLKGDWPLEEAVLKLKRDTRRYAKRQLTWLRSESDAVWIAPDETERALGKIRGFLNETP
jgi:tRNA dimethylallyltransferase